MVYLFAAILVLILTFGGVILRGAPYLPTLNAQAKAALDLLNLKPGQTLLELGSGDGKVLLAAAQAGLNVVGVELNPFLVIVSWLRTRRYRKQVRIIWGDFWRGDWPEADAIFTFLLTKYMKKLDNKIVQYKHKPGKPITAEKSGVYLYTYR